MIRILIVEDHEIIRMGLKKILLDEPDILVVGEQSNGTDLLGIVSDVECDVILLDLNIPGRNGIELIEELKRKRPAVHILVLSISPESKFALPSLNAGASGYLSKDAALNELVDAIRKIHTKGRYLSHSLAENLAFNLLKPDSMSVSKLTSFETNIGLMIANGTSAKDIALELGISVSTVFIYRRKIFEKLKLHSNIELAHYAMENNMGVF